VDVWVWVVVVFLGWLSTSLLCAPFMIRYLRYRRRTAGIRPIRGHYHHTHWATTKDEDDPDR